MKKISRRALIAGVAGTALASAAAVYGVRGLAPSRSLEKMAIYYSWPSHVNNSEGNAELAAQSFSSFDLVVLGSSLEFQSHPEYNETKEIIEKLRNPAEGRKKTAIFGYVDSGVTTSNLSLEKIAESINGWKEIKADGIFYDCLSPDYGVTIARLNEVIGAVRKSGMKLFGNCDKPAWIKSANVLRKEDSLLIEPFLISEGKEIRNSYAALKQLIAESGSQFYGVGTYDINDSAEKKAEQKLVLERKAKEIGLAGVCFTNSMYSSSGPEQNHLAIF